MITGHSRSVTTGAAGAAREAEDSAWVSALARLGLVSRGVVWLVIGLLGVSVVLGRDEETDRQGALRAIADRAFGEPLLLVLVVGFAGYALWRLLQAAVGHRDEDGAKRTGKRALSAARAGLYGYLAFTTATFLAGARSGGDETTSRTADVMARDGGRWLVGAVGVAVVVVGVVLAVRAVQRKHAEKLEQWRVPDRLPVVALGTVGLVGRALVLALVGGFLVRAAVLFDPAEAKGLDAALQALAAQPYGPVLLAVAVLGVLAYAVWSFVEAAFRET